MKRKLKRLSGGSWFDDAENCRAAVRDAIRPGYRYDPFGFRLTAKASASGVALRGGSFFNSASYCRPAAWIYYHLDGHFDNFGFRLTTKKEI